MTSIKDLRTQILEQGLAIFVARDVKVEHLPGMAWSGDVLHLDVMREQLLDTEIPSDTLAICTPDGQAVSKGFVTHDLDARESTISQLATHPSLQSLGIGTYLISSIEDRIRERGSLKASLGVEHTNTRARRLYEKLGYKYFATKSDSWEAINHKGETYRHETSVHWLSKQI